MKNLKLLLVANRLAIWESWTLKTDDIKNWAKSGNINLTVDLKHTTFSDIPFIDYNYQGDPYDNKIIIGNNLFGVDPVWYDENVSQLGIGYDIVCFVIPPSQWKGEKAAGWRYDRTFGPMELQISSTNEFETYQVNGKSYLKCLMYLKHELSHSFYEIAKLFDRTHEFYYNGDWYSEKAIQAIQWPEPNLTDKYNIFWDFIYNLLKPFMKQEIIKNDLKLANFCLAIQSHEGWFPGSRSERNKNPGNLRYVGQKLAIGKDKNNFAVFSTYEDGFNTLKEMIKRAASGFSKVYSPEDTLLQFFGKYAPSFDLNDPNNYAQVVAKEIGVDVSFQIKNLIS